MFRLDTVHAQLCNAMSIGLVQVVERSKRQELLHFSAGVQVVILRTGLFREDADVLTEVLGTQLFCDE